MVRYFTVYGSWGRPDMAIWKFTDALLGGRPLDVYAGGGLARDFTHVSDTVEATLRLLARAPRPDPGFAPGSRPDASWAPFAVYNIGRSDPVTVNEMIALLEAITGARALRNEMPMQPGDVERTWSDTRKLHADTGFEPKVALAEGLREFVDWFRGWRAR